MKTAFALTNKLKRDQRGNVESALVLIPLLILFLTILQVAASSLNRKEVSVALNGEATNFNINSDLAASPLNVVGPRPNYPFSDSTNTINLPTGSQLVITKRSSNFPIISPLLFGGDRFTEYGLSVQ
jgi:hypothetical protein